MPATSESVMLATSGDVLNIAIAVGVVVLSIFLCMFLFYLILILRDVSKVVDKPYIDMIVDRGKVSGEDEVEE